MQVRINTAALEELTKNLKQVSGATGKRAAQRALYSASSLVSEAARQNIRSEGLIKTGNLERSIGVAGIPEANGKIGTKVGILKFNGDVAVKLYQGHDSLEGIDRDAFYGRFSDQGTVHERARQWMQRAGASQIEAVVERFGTRTREELEKAIQKMNVRRSLK